MKNKQAVIYSLIIFLFSFLIYILTAAPDLTFTDSGELAAACSTLGIAHPTGYPLFTLLGHLWTYLPIPGTEIYSLNLFAGFLTAASSVVFFNMVLLLLNHINIIVKKDTKTKSQIKKKSGDAQKVKTVQEKSLPEKYILIISLTTAFLFAFARTIWAQAVAIEVYSLHLLMMNLIILFFLKGILSNENGKKYLIISALLLGLSFTNHMTTILLMPMMLFLYFKRPGRKADFSSDNFKFLLILIIPFVVGLSLYLYMPLRAAAMPEFNWGWISRSFDKFWYHFSGRQYQVWMFSDSAIMKENIVKFFESIPLQVAWIGIIPLLLGIAVSFMKSKTLLFGIVILILTCIAYAVNYSIHDIESYFVTAFAGLMLFIGIGLWKFVKMVPNSAYAFLALPMISLALNYTYNDRSDDYLVPEYTKILFQKLEPNALILSSQWDFWVSAAWYMQRVERFRTDVVIIDKELLRRTWYLDQIKRWYPERIKPCEKAINDYLVDLELFESGKDYSPVSIQGKFINLLNCFVDENYEKYPCYLTMDVIETEKGIACRVGYAQRGAGCCQLAAVSKS